MFHGQIDEKPTVAKYESGKRHDSENDNQHTRANQHIAGAFLLLLIELRRVQQCHRACPPYKVSLSLDTGNEQSLPASHMGTRQGRRQTRAGHRAGIRRLRQNE